MKSLISSILILLLVFCWMPGTCQAISGDTSTEGAAITLGLFVTVLAVFFLVNAKTDADNVFGGKSFKGNLARQLAQTSAPEAGMPADSTGWMPGNGLGLRVEF